MAGPVRRIGSARPTPSILTGPVGPVGPVTQSPSMAGPAGPVGPVGRLVKPIVPIAAGPVGPVGPITPSMRLCSGRECQKDCGGKNCLREYVHSYRLIRLVVIALCAPLIPSGALFL